MTFLEQFQQLREKTPYIGLQCVQNVNSPYCQYTEKSKNCYMTFASYESEDCSYNTRVFYCRDCNDCTFCYKCELCYQSLDCINSYNCNYCIYCENVYDSDYCQYCIGTKKCFGCVGLHQAKFQIFNQPVDPDKYEEQIAELKKLPPEEIQRRIEPLLTTVPRSAMYGKHNENSYGENIHHCKNTYWGFDSKYLWDCMYCYHCDESKDLHDCSHLGWSELCYEIMSGGNLNNCMFCYGCWHSNDLTYCDLAYSSRNCFGCIGINHGKYMILNQQYEEDEYFKKVEEIKAQMKADNEWGQWQKSTYDEVLTYGI